MESYGAARKIAYQWQDGTWLPTTGRPDLD
jgi:hypothetical protein